MNVRFWSETAPVCQFLYVLFFHHQVASMMKRLFLRETSGRSVDPISPDDHNTHSTGDLLIQRNVLFVFLEIRLWLEESFANT